MSDLRVSRWTTDGIDCATVRVKDRDPRWCWWCGYVRVPEGHPWHGRDDGEIDPGVFGGVTWSGKMPDRLGDGWWVGFDTAHGPRPWDWPRERVVAETDGLARAALEAA